MKKENILSENEWLEWMQQHIKKGYTAKFYEDAIEFRIKQLKEKK